MRAEVAKEAVTRVVLGALVAASLLTGTQASAGLRCAGKAATIVGTRHSDSIAGTPGPDGIVGRGGNADRFGGGPGSDLLGDERSEQGDDVGFGGKGRDVIALGEGDDVLKGGLGRDQASYYVAAAGIRANLDREVARGEGSDRPARGGGGLAAPLRRGPARP